VEAAQQVGDLERMMGRFVLRFRWMIVAAWLLAAGLLVALVPEPDPSANELRSFLPDDMPSRRAAARLGEAFPRESGLSEAVVIFERRDGELSPGDMAAVARVAEGLRREAGRSGALSGATVAAPADLAYLEEMGLRNPTVSRGGEAGQAAIVAVRLPASFVTNRSAEAVRRIQHVVRDEGDLPAGLAAAVTGDAAYGHDYAAAAEISHRRTLWVTLTAVVAILLLVYRAPIAAAIPLCSISVAAAVAMRLLSLGQGVGMHVGTGEKIFVFVLLYGAGIDYSLLFISRYRELFDAGAGHPGAAEGGLNATFGAILASAVTDTCGLLMLCFARHAAFRTTGPAVAVALLTALAAAVTLVPALLAIVGPRAFWPSGRMGRVGARRLWPKVAAVVVRRPGLAMALVLALLAAPAVRGASLRWVYDTLATLRGDYDAPRGAAMVRRHWPVGEIAPVKIVVEAPRARSGDEWRRASRRLTAAIGEVAGVRDVRSLTQPLGREAEALRDLRAEADTPLLPPALRQQFRAELERARRLALDGYVGAGGRVMRLEAVLDHEPFALPAMNAVRAIRRTAGAAAEGMQVRVAGATAETIDVQAVTQRDFIRVGALALAVIFAVVLVLLRDAILSAYMVAATVLSYLTTLGATCWVFTALLGAPGLDWKVQVFLFVVMVAVGVDYSIFLAARFRQEARHVAPAEAMERAVVATGPVISSCGLIMAATLGSLMAGDLALLVQLGFALALGMLIDTFVVRPVLLPAFAVLTRRGRPR
jgi:RND superfamily putative drug exporter